MRPEIRAGRLVGIAGRENCPMIIITRMIANPRVLELSWFETKLNIEKAAIVWFDTRTYWIYMRRGHGE